MDILQEPHVTFTKGEIFDRIEERYPYLHGLTLTRVKKATWYEVEIVQSLKVWRTRERAENVINYMMSVYHKGFNQK